MVTPEATIVHHGGASETTREGKMVKLLAAKATLVDRHFPRWQRAAGLALNAAWPLTRWIALAGLATLTGSPETRARADAWHGVWRRRAEWQNGFAIMSPPSPPASAATLSSPV